LQVPNTGAQRASSHRSARLVAFPILALVIALGGLSATATPASAAGVKVVIVVGPVESSTAHYKSAAKSYAALARKYGASVTEIYSPRATWTRVKAAAKGANIFIYLGHGNGHPSPYGAFYADRKDGLGLNRTYNNGNSNVKYYGEKYVQASLDLARNSVVILNHLCYASGNSEPGRALPSMATAKKRADNYGAGFLRAGARTVFATGMGSASWLVRALLTTNLTMGQIFKADPSFTGTHDFTFASVRTNPFTVWMDPYATRRYYHSMVGRPSMTAATVRAG
jgi:hypothetical protein